MRPGRLAALYRLVFAGLSLAAVATQLSVTISKQYGLVNFFSYFTNLGNLIASVVLIVSAVRVLSGNRETAAGATLRGASVVYIVFVGLVFNTLLRDAELGDLLPWVNAVVHFITPAAVLLDWILWPPRARIRWTAPLLWLSFPAVYVAYSLIRGPVARFYPYPFFNPAAVGGYPGVAVYCVVMLAGFLVLAVLIRGSAYRRRHTTPPASL